jgi:hypothetical protein
MNLKNKIVAIICHRPTCSEGEECTCGAEDKAEAIMELMNREWCEGCDTHQKYKDLLQKYEPDYDHNGMTFVE